MVLSCHNIWSVTLVLPMCGVLPPGGACLWPCLFWDLCYHASVTLSFYGRLAGVVVSNIDPSHSRYWCWGPQVWILVVALTVIESKRTMVRLAGNRTKGDHRKAYVWQLLHTFYWVSRTCSNQAAHNPSVITLGCRTLQVMRNRITWYSIQLDILDLVDSV